jgi:signal transduction histidine kinase
MNAPQLSRDLVSRVVAHLPSRFQPGRMPYAFFFVALMIAVLLGYSVYPALPPFRWVYLTMVVFLVALLTAFQKGLPLPWAVNLGTSIGMLLLIAVGWFTGGIFSLNIAWLMILPLTPLYMIGWRAGLAWYGAMLLIVSGLGLASHMQWLPVYDLQRSKDGQAYTTYSILTMVMIVVPMIYDRMYVNALRIIRAYQQELEAKRLELEHTLRMREHFIGIVSHELRTPMNAIVGFNALLLSRVQDRPEAVKALQHTGRAADHLMTVINDILDYSQLQAGQLMVQRETFVLRDVALHAGHGTGLPHRARRGLAHLGEHRPPPPDAGAGEPVGQRLEIHAPRLGGAARAMGKPGRAVFGARHRHRHSPRAARPHLPPLCPGRRQHPGPLRWQRFGLGDIASVGRVAGR